MSTMPLHVFIGYDPREPEAYHVLSHSILRRASIPISITPIIRSQLTGIYTRVRGPNESTDFTYSRFLVPYLSDYIGWSVFMDCDMLCRADMVELLMQTVLQSEKAVLCCPHNYETKVKWKMLNQPQTSYPRKNWSSLMVFNNAKCKMLTPNYINTATGMELHRFMWMPDELIGQLDLEWNWLVGEYKPNSDAKMWHWTLGGPWFPNHRETDHAADWFAERDLVRANTPVEVVA